jgi:phosphate transport system protein
MLKQLLSLFGTSDVIARMGEDFSKMLECSYDITIRAGHMFFEESSEADERIEISKRDVKINKLERRIRKQVIAHLTLGSDAGHVPYCLLLMSIVKDVERVGDYAKNLAQVHYEGGGPIPDDERGAELRDLRRIVEGTFAEARDVFTTSDSDSATALILQGRHVNKRCDVLIADVTQSGYDAATTTTMVLGARYYKRIESHLMNILSGVVMPLHKLDYYDERLIDMEPDADADPHQSTS